MKRFIILFILLFSISAFSQGDQKPASIPAYSLPFTAGNDTILSAKNLYSAVLDVGKFNGAITIGIQSDTMAAGGTVAKAISVYWKERLTGMSWGVPSDSIAADSILLGVIDSSYVNDETPWYLKISLESWWGFTDQGYLILDPATGADSIRVICRVRGQ